MGSDGSFGEGEMAMGILPFEVNRGGLGLSHRG